MTCTVSSGSGTVATDNITSISVSCLYTNKVIFVTFISFTGAIGGISAADSYCNSDSNKPDNGSYKAMIVDGTNRVACTTAGCSGGAGEHTDWIMAASTSYYRSDGTTLIATTTANGVFNLVTGLTNSFTSGLSYIWTGMAGNWTSTAGSCINWSSADSGNSTTVGATNTTNSDSISTSLPNCSGAYKLACVRQN
jgi:hypothetical protein